MGRIQKGMLVKTSYNSGPYIVESVEGNCDCPSFLDSLEFSEAAPRSKPHTHIRCNRLGGNKKEFYYLNGYDENLNCVWNSDRLILLHEETLLLCFGLCL